VTTTVYLRLIRGVAKIGTMEAHPIRYYHDETGMKEQGLREMAIERGKKWFSLFGIHHVQYDGVAGQRANNGQGAVTRHYVNSRIMVDRATFRRNNPSFRFPPPLPPVVEVDENGNPTNTWGPNHPPPQVPPPPASDPTIQPSPQVGKRPAARSAGTTVVATDAYEEITMDDYTEEDYLLASTLVYGFSLSDKIWLEFSVSTIRPVEWNETAFNNLVLPSGRKDLLKSLIEVHHQGLNFDDFIKGKGHGLIINLYGPPGVGKTFSAEATSEHVKRPLYIVGAGDLGTNANILDKALEKVFNLATIWKAIVLIDEADVFLEQRSLKDLERNAMVAAFLRHVEYYRGILFLTTNRIKTFDEAFLSRIHVALHFTELSLESKIQIWTAFLGKVGALVESGGEITEAEITELSKREINGRQIKNAVRTAQSLASAKGQKLAYAHVVQTLDAMEEFTREFEKAIVA
ncbi:ATPase family AAA domain-containing protein 3B, partial [Leucoagaricus sp. SymC.cos]